MAFSSAVSAPQMDWEAPDIVATFSRFKQKCELMFCSVLKSANDEERASYLLLWVGEQGLDKYNSWTFEEEEDRKKPDKLLSRFQKHLEPRSNHRIYRYKLQDMRQNVDEAADDFVTKMKAIAVKCKYRDDKEMEDRLVDQLIWGSSHKDVQKVLIGRDEKLTLNDAIDVARSHEATTNQLKSLPETSRNSNTAGKTEQSINASRTTRSKQPGKGNKPPTCYNCGRVHDLKPKSNCPAYGSTCRNCGKENHWQSVCRSGKPPKGKPPHKSPRRRVHYFDEEEIIDEYLTIGTIEVSSIGSSDDTRDEVFAKLRINQKGRKPIMLRCKVDTGAQSNLLPVHLFRIIFPEKLDSNGNPEPSTLETSKMALTAYGGSKIKQLGTVKIPCMYNDTKHNCVFYVTDAAGPAILGLKTCQALNLITLHCAVETTTVVENEQTNNPVQLQQEKLTKDTCSGQRVHFADPSVTRTESPTPHRSPKYIQRNTPLLERPNIGSKSDLLEMYPDCFDGTVGYFENFKYRSGSQTGYTPTT